MPKVIVGMSGGVDSSVTAYLLQQLGLEVEGVSFILWEARARSNFTTCCSLEATDSAAKTARSLGIRHASVDVRDEFIEKVIDPFIDSYTKGLTPNPCILCNRNVKFPFLLREAKERGADFIATGHYARIARVTLPGAGSGGEEEIRSGAGGVLLKKGIDPGKDQSYVLYVLQHEELEKLLLPLGEYRKKDVREIARSLQLDAADRPESQEICFIQDRNYFRFIEALNPSAGEEGPIMNSRGKVLGAHRGIYRYTIGQRKGLGISSPEPCYVTRIDLARNTVHVGPRDEAMVKEMIVGDLNWIPSPESGIFRATVKVRSMMEDRPASIDVSGATARVLFDEPQWAPAPGQSAVFYDGDRVKGGGIIQSISAVPSLVTR